MPVSTVNTDTNTITINIPLAFQDAVFDTQVKAARIMNQLPFDVRATIDLSLLIRVCFCHCYFEENSPEMFLIFKSMTKSKQEMLELRKYSKLIGKYIV